MSAASYSVHFVAPEQGASAVRAEDETARLPLARYAEVLAHVVHFPREDKGEVLARLGVREDDWTASDGHWRGALAAEVAREEAVINAELGAVFAPVRARLKRERPAIESIGPLPGGASGGAEEQGRVAPDRERVVEGAGAPASPQEGPGPTAIAAGEPSPASVVAAAAAVVVPAETPTFMREAAALPGPARAVVVASKQGGVPSPSVPVARPVSTETAAIDVAAILRASMPFEASAPGAAAAAVSRPPVEPRVRAGSSTETTAVDVSKILRTSVPFAAPSTSAATSAPSKGGAPAGPASGFGETEELDLGALMRQGPAVPFGGAHVAQGDAGGAKPAAPGQGSFATMRAGRWVRFDPQTGQPLAEPRWEDLSTPERKR